MLSFAKIFSYVNDCKFVGMIKSVDDISLLQLELM